MTMIGEYPAAMTQGVLFENATVDEAGDDAYFVKATLVDAEGEVAVEFTVPKDQLVIFTVMG